MPGFDDAHWARQPRKRWVIVDDATVREELVAPQPGIPSGWTFSLGTVHDEIDVFDTKEKASETLRARLVRRRDSSETHPSQVPYFNEMLALLDKGA